MEVGTLSVGQDALLRDEELQSLATELRADALQHDQAVVQEVFDNLEGMELPVQSFLEVFRSNPQLQQRVALAADLKPGELEEVDLEAWFQSMDMDASSTLSFDEFVAGLVKIRSSRHAEDLEAVMQEALVVAAKAFEDANLSRQGDLDLTSFVEALLDPETQMQLSFATKLPMEYFESLTIDSVTDLFNQIDVDASGSVSFKEWVSALVRTRFDTYQQEKEEEAELFQAAADDGAVQLAEEAFDDADNDWSGEISLQEFITAFRTNPRFLAKVSMTIEVSEEELSMLHDDELESLFQSLDKDLTGQLSFGEFVRGLVDIRNLRQEAKQLDEQFQEDTVMEQAYLDACAAFDEADFQYKRQLDLRTFMEAMSDPSVAESMSNATKLPLEYFQSLDTHDKERLFREIDTDESGAVSFEEWVRALVNARFATYQQEKAEEEEEAEFAAQLAEEAFDDADEARLAVQGASGVPQNSHHYQLPEWILNLPPLHDAEKALIDAALFKLKRRGIATECKPRDLSLLVQELYLWAPENMAKATIEDAFPGRDLAVGFNDPEDWYVLYQAVLSRQPVWTMPLTKSAQAREPLTARDLQSHESSMRRAYDKFARNFGGAMSVDDLGEFFIEAGLADKDLDLPRILSDFEGKRKPGCIHFPEIVELCNDVISGMLRNSSNDNFSRLLRVHPKRAYAGIAPPPLQPGARSPRKPPPLPTLGQVYLGETGAAWTGNRRGMKWIGQGGSVIASPRAVLHGRLPPL
eukprot:TRINITY_DN103485_c0_g1_i1.p1 TRINITY_DN103485_c0_g1~~TRINITY_DN103485_c0_g1_i1.p1  ORF type:complete len:752 (+),score=171.08 TRINITY_DN103485_c0_g1_i1:93-2348(+)